MISILQAFEFPAYNFAPSKQRTLALPSRDRHPSRAKLIAVRGNTAETHVAKCPSLSGPPFRGNMSELNNRLSQGKGNVNLSALQLCMLYTLPMRFVCAWRLI